MQSHSAYLLVPAQIRSPADAAQYIAKAKAELLAQISELHHNPHTLPEEYRSKYEVEFCRLREIALRMNSDLLRLYLLFNREFFDDVLQIILLALHQDSYFQRDDYSYTQVLLGLSDVQACLGALQHAMQISAAIEQWVESSEGRQHQWIVNNAIDAMSRSVTSWMFKMRHSFSLVPAPSSPPPSKPELDLSPPVWPLRAIPEGYAAACDRSSEDSSAISEDIDCMVIEGCAKRDREDCVSPYSNVRNRSMSLQAPALNHVRPPKRRRMSFDPNEILDGDAILSSAMPKGVPWDADAFKRELAGLTRHATLEGPSSCGDTRPLADETKDEVIAVDERDTTSQSTSQTEHMANMSSASSLQTISGRHSKRITRLQITRENPFVGEPPYSPDDMVPDNTSDDYGLGIIFPSAIYDSCSIRYDYWPSHVHGSGIDNSTGENSASSVVSLESWYTVPEITSVPGLSGFNIARSVRHGAALSFWRRMLNWTERFGIR